MRLMVDSDYPLGFQVVTQASLEALALEKVRATF